ncbi:probable malonyl-CoA-acyl carrier protein transacylase, mitochondrial isoform X1 [Sitodiplosis mosellana]|uniref:probable malonyl-CoA-acyl carrier protein transacylase, mitochondrial isoform X1 n=1 Tax=Sitodiplosis mosellana TaxID=263140 RepID=UPI00244493CF|nr:probable malonyl-CoA-acyl carrier protein transacylase, mitochondrial isoform X1 [Sitodiplosis mosellana]
MIPNIFRGSLSRPKSYCLNRGIKLKSRDFHRSAFVTNKIEDNSVQNNKQTIKNLLESSAAFVETSPKQSLDEWATLPYVEGTILSKKDRNDMDIQRPKIDPRDTSIILFPGQGAQFVGMAKSLENVPVAKDLFDYASEILNYDLLKLCNKGPAKELDDIRYSHVAIMTASLANLELLREERPDAVLNCVATAGFSLGEITALVFAGALQFGDALHLVQVRAEAIHAAAEIYKGGMASIYFRPDSRVIEACQKAKEWCLKNNVERAECLISNFMFPRYKVLSGSEEALQYLEENFKKFRIGSIKRIKNAPACHSILMEPAVEPVRSALEHIHVTDPLIRVYSNVSGKMYMSAEHILKLLPEQLVKPVKWEQTMHMLYARRHKEYFPRTIVCGPGVALRSILRSINSKAWQQSIHIGDRKRK